MCVCVCVCGVWCVCGVVCVCVCVCVNSYYICFLLVIWKYFFIKKFLKIAAYGLFIESRPSFSMHILILPCPWALFGSSCLIILRTCSSEKSVDLKIDSVWVLNLVSKWTLLTRDVHWPTKYELTSSHVFITDQYF